MMSTIGGLVRRNGLVLIAAGAVAGIALPGLADATRPWLVAMSILVMLAGLLRIEPSAFGQVMRRPLLAVLILAWVTFGVPLLVWLVLRSGLPEGSAYLSAAVLMSAAPSIMSAAAFALLLGADAALLTVVAIPSNALAPVWLPLVAGLMGLGAQVDPFDMAQRLAIMVGGSFAGAWLVVCLVGRTTLRQAAPSIDAWIVVLVSVSALPCMAGVGRALADSPLRFIGMFGFALGLNLLLQAVGYLVFRRAAVAGALSAALITGSRNMVLLLAALGAPGDSDLGLIVSAAQLTLFVMPLMVAPSYRAIARLRHAG